MANLLKQFLVLLLFNAATVLCATGQAAGRHPNVVFIYVDDLGYGDLSCYGATKIKTPHTDKIASQGLLFTNGHTTSATCTPSRYALMSGEYPWRKPGHNILPGDAALIVAVDKTTLPGVFKKRAIKPPLLASGIWALVTK